MWMDLWKFREPLLLSFDQFDVQFRLETLETKAQMNWEGKQRGSDAAAREWRRETRGSSVRGIVNVAAGQ